MEVLIVLVLVGSIFAYFLMKRGESLRFETSAEPQEVINTAVSLIATKRRWQTMAMSETSATFGYHKGYNKAIAVFLFLFFIIPMIVYLLIAGKKESLAVSTSRSGQGTVVQIASNGWQGKQAGRAIQKQLGIPAQQVESQALAGGEDMRELQSVTGAATGLNTGPAASVGSAEAPAARPVQ